jgi:hypothetical protein
MATKQKQVIYKDYFKFMEDWRQGRSQKFKPGDVVELSKDVIGVVQFALANYGEYQVKRRINDKPWEYIEARVSELQMKKSDKPNPFKYKFSDMVPGPSSTEIDILNERMYAFDEKKKKEKSGREVDAYVSALEEEIGYKKEMKKAEDKDKIISDEDEDAGAVASIEIDPIAEKREKIISEE